MPPDRALGFRILRHGLFLNTQLPSEQDPGRFVEELLEQVSFVREARFASVFCGQHFLTEPFGMLQTVPLLARVAGESGHMSVGAGILLVTLLNPVEVAENVATLDAITGGRSVLGVGLGYRQVENDAFAVPERRVATFRDKLDVVRRLLEGEAVTAEGAGYRLEGARLSLLPVQRPRPPIWIAANNDVAVRRAARLGDTWFLNPHVTLDELERQIAIFRDERGGPPDELPAIRELCVAATDEEALAIARPYLAPKYEAYVAWGQSEALPPSDTLRREWEELLAGGRFIIGGPETVGSAIRAHRDRLGVTQLVYRVQWPGMPHAEALRTLRLLAEEVLPRL